MADSQEEKEEEGEKRLNAIKEALAKMEEEGLLVYPDGKNRIEWRWDNEKGVRCFAKEQISPYVEKKNTSHQRKEDLLAGLLYSVRGDLDFGGAVLSNKSIGTKEEKEEYSRFFQEAMQELPQHVKEHEDQKSISRELSSLSELVLSFLKVFVDPPPKLVLYFQTLPPISSIPGIHGMTIDEIQTSFSYTGAVDIFLTEFEFADAFCKIIDHFIPKELFQKTCERYNVTKKHLIFYAMFIARSRSFEEAGFIPIVDLINGSMDSRVVNVEKKTDLISGSGPLPSFPSFGLWHSLRANCIIKKGEELFADYGTTFSHEEQDLAGCLLKYATMAVTRTLSGKDSIKGVKLQMNQVYDDFLPLQKEFLRKFGEFDRADADVGLWLHNSVPRPFNFQIGDPEGPFFRQLGIVRSVTDEGTLNAMVQSGRLRVPNLDLAELANALRSFIHATLKSPTTFNGLTTPQLIQRYEDLSLNWAERNAARIRAAERELLLEWDYAIYLVSPPPNPLMILQGDPQKRMDLKLPDQYCEACGRTLFLSLCSKCKKVRYCNRVCQRGNWSKHKKNCRK